VRDYKSGPTIAIEAPKAELPPTPRFGSSTTTTTTTTTTTEATSDDDDDDEESRKKRQSEEGDQSRCSSSTEDTQSHYGELISINSQITELPNINIVTEPVSQ